MDDLPPWAKAYTPDLQAAIGEAQRTFPRFAQAMPMDGDRDPTVEVALALVHLEDPRDPARNEVVALADAAVMGAMVVGTLATQPQVLTDLPHMLSAPASRLYDWILVREGRGEGGFAIRARARHLDPDSLDESLAHPPLCWFADELEAVRGETVQWLSGNDPAIRDAIARAQETFPKFAELLDADADRPDPLIEVACVKAFFSNPETPTAGEHIFLSEVWIDEDWLIHGVLNSTPTSVRGLAEGQEVAVPLDRLSDWIAVVDGRGIGGFTIAVLAQRMPSAEYARLRHHPPFSWFAD